MKVLLDTNVFRRFIDSKNEPKKQEVLLNVFKDNECFVGYGTLFELASCFHDNKNTFSDVISLVSQSGITLATRAGFDIDRLCQLIYFGQNLSDKELDEIFRSLLTQTADAVCNLLAQFFYLFSVLYAYMKLNKISDAYEAYLCYTAEYSNTFENFKEKAYNLFSKLFYESYYNEADDVITEKFKDIVILNLWDIVCVIESRFYVLGGKPDEYLDEFDWNIVFNESKNNFIKLNPKGKCMDCIKKTYLELGTGNKKYNELDEVMSLIDSSRLSSIGRDFMEFYFRNRLLVGEGTFKYNDIIDFFNLQSALELTDCFLTFDLNFLKKKAVRFQSILSSDFLEKSTEYSEKVYDEWKNA